MGNKKSAFFQKPSGQAETFFAMSINEQIITN